ncbi:pentapeptide repeat-containing protein [Sulfurimonas sp.]|uniref:pentapeptide repeat-containing protein n=1 Tax=Sulfurimonas sp. TaxID=2022749 RepID=UPI003567CCB2
MSTNDKNKKAFSYKFLDRRGRNFLYKNFNKSSSFNANFSEAIFSGTSFIGTKFKICSFYGSTFNGCLLQGTLFNKCNLTNATFENTIIISSSFKNTKLRGCKFYNCKIFSTKLKPIIPERNLTNSTFLDKVPDSKNFNQELLYTIESLRANDYIRRSKVLHRKKGLLNTISIEVLVSEFGENFLIENLPELANITTNEFHTLSYIQNLLKKIQKNDTI